MPLKLLNKGVAKGSVWAVRPVQALMERGQVAELAN